jgi:hypothetical protein
MANPFIYGRDSFAKCYIGNPPKPFNIWAKKIHVQEKASVQWDGVCGENRGRPIKITDGFIVTIDTYDDGSTKYLENYIAAQSNDDAGNPPIGFGSGLVFRSAGGVSVVVFGGITVLDPLDYSVEGRMAANTGVVKFNSQYMNKGPGVAI